MQLAKDSLLQGGKYKIERTLGQGGFGITYLGEHVALNRKVAIKEFFMKEYCERDKETSHVSLGTSGSRELVERFRYKFMKEAQTIAALDHPHIIRIYDVFEENGTAYYVMEYHGNGSLADYVKMCKCLDEKEALQYIHQIADALDYIHKRRMNHLDVKPGNVLLSDRGEVVLIDFGMSKRYDEEGKETSTTPVGISHGYAPLEQYKKTLNQFSPATDIYSLGATLYKLLTGNTPPDAAEMYRKDVLEFSGNITDKTKAAIIKAMQPYREDRPQTIDELLDIWVKDAKSELEDENTELHLKNNPGTLLTIKNKKHDFHWKQWVGWFLCIGLLLGIIFFFTRRDIVSRQDIKEPEMITRPLIKDTVPIVKQDSSISVSHDIVNVNHVTDAIIEPKLTIRTLRNSTDLSAMTTRFKDGDDFYLYLSSTADMYVAVFMEDKGKLFQILPYNIGDGAYKLSQGKGTFFFNSSPNELIMTCENRRAVNKMHVVSSEQQFQMENVKMSSEDELPYLEMADYELMKEKYGLRVETVEIVTSK